MDASTPLLCFSRLTEWFHLRYNCCNVSYTLLEIIYQEAIMSFFNLDSPVMRFLTKVADLIILNILFLICCIPIVTIGAASTALYTVTMKSVRDEESYVIRSYFKAFKDNFKIGTFSWLIALALGIVLTLDFRILPALPETMAQVLRMFLIAVSLFYAIFMIYLFPYIARFENTLKGTLKNALILGIACLPYTLLLLLIHGAAIVATLFIDFRIVGFLWITIGFSGVAYACSYLLRRAFAKFE